MPLNFHRSRDFLCNFDFHGLFIQELGWNQPRSDRPEPVVVEDVTYQRRRIAEMSVVPVFEVTAPDGEIPLGERRLQIYKAIAPFLSVSFGAIDGKDICRVTVQPGPKPTYVTLKDPKIGQPVEHFFIRTGNSINKLDKPSDILKYSATRWGT